MDWSGQQLCELLYQILLIGFSTVGFIIGYMKESFIITVYAIGLGFLVSLIVCLPDWPCFRKHPLKWLPVQANPANAEDNNDAKNATVGDGEDDGEEAGNNKKKVSSKK